MNQIKNGFTNHLVPNEFFLSQNYPNPFKEKLSVYNSEGILIETLVDKEQNAGSYEIEFNSGLLQEGVYYYQLKTYNYLENKEMILKK